MITIYLILSVIIGFCLDYGYYCLRDFILSLSEDGDVVPPPSANGIV